MAGRAPAWAAVGLVWTLAACGDTESPRITSVSELTGTSDTLGPYQVHATIEDDRNVALVQLHYGTAREVHNGPEWLAEPMKSLRDGRYRGEIPGGFVPGTEIRYYVTARDRAGNEAREPSDGFFAFEIIGTGPPDFDAGVE